MELGKLKDHNEAIDQFKNGKIVVIEKNDQWHYYIYPGEDDVKYINMKRGKWGQAITGYYVVKGEK